MTILSVESVSRRFGGLMALADVSFSVEEGEILGLIGPNGAGKTTMFNLVAGNLKSSEGRIVFRDRAGALTETALGRPERAAWLGISRTFQNIRLFGGLSVLDNVRIGRHPRSRGGFWGSLLRTRTWRREEAVITDAAMDRLRFVGLDDCADQAAASLSYGNQRLLEIARALASEPRLILLDEPAAGMNPQETRELTQLIGRIREQGVTVVLIEHDMRLVMSVCDRLVVLDHGVKIAEGAPREIRENPLVVEAYLGRGAAHA